jgi:Holliday junction resolvase RusA-like endonuclease
VGDDSQVEELVVRKAYGKKNPRIELTINEPVVV